MLGKWVVDQYKVKGLGACGHSPADLDMFSFHGFAIVVDSNVVRERWTEIGATSDGRMDLIRAPGWEIWEERIRAEFLVDEGVHCEICCGALRAFLSRDFLLFCEGAKYKHGYRCSGRIGLRELGFQKMPKLNAS